MTERLIVEYVPEAEKPLPKEPERISMETCEEHATEVKLRKRASESQKEKRAIQVGRIEEIDLDLTQRETERVRLSTWTSPFELTNLLNQSFDICTYCFHKLSLVVRF